ILCDIFVSPSSSCFVRHLSSSFFFQCSVRPRALHSFPTRRSSDLAVVEAGGDADEFLVDLPHVPHRRAFDRAEVGRLRAVVAARSEEHTSELQSRRDLVCRLLLEKKKKKKESL